MRILSKTFRCSILSISAMFIGMAFGTGASAGRIGLDPPKRVQVVQSDKELKAVLDATLSGSEGKMFVLSQKNYMQDIHLPQARAGLLKDLAILLPTDKALNESVLPEIRHNLAESGMTQMDLQTFAFDNGLFRGFAGHVPVRIFPLNRIPEMSDGRVLLVLDPMILLASYRNEQKTPITELARKLIVTLRDKKVVSDDIVLIDPEPIDDLTLRYGYLALLLREMIESPGTFGDSIPAKWEILQQAEYAYSFARYPEAMNLYRSYLDKMPNDASACYKIAMMAARDLDGLTALQWLNKSAAVDARYRRGYVEAADYFEKKDMQEAAEQILLGGVSSYPKDSRLATSLAVLYVSEGQKAWESGDTEGAAEYFEMATSLQAADAVIKEKARKLARGENPKPGPPVRQ
jgi:tetratricopeptide (TPR) repeat protein